MSINFFDQSPSSIKIQIAQYLDIPDLRKLVQSSKSQAVFKPRLEYMLEVRRFLQSVARGEANKMAAMLRKNCNLLLERGKLTDCSGRTFFNISGFEYALWAFDQPMWTRMLANLPNTKQGIKIKIALRDQYLAIKQQGITYTLNDAPMTAPEQHFDFQNTVIKELQFIVDSANTPNPDWEALNKRWVEGVGGAQKLLPMNIAEYYCSFSPGDSRQCKRAKQFYNMNTYEDESWFHADSKLGIDFAVFMGGIAPAFIGPGGRINKDLAAFKKLNESRTKDFNELGLTLGCCENNKLDMTLSP